MGEGAVTAALVNAAPATRRTNAPLALRVRPAPPLDPPFDDERPTGVSAYCPGQLELHPPRPAIVVPDTPDPAGPPGGSTSGSVGGPAGEAGRAARSFVNVCVEVLNGFRPVTHLRPFVAPSSYTRMVDQLTRRAVRLRMAATTVPGQPRPPTPNGSSAWAGGPGGRSGGGSGGRGSVGARGPRVALRRMHVCEPRAGAVEAAVVLSHGGATWAMAVRMERHERQWHCTSMQVI
jgi:hypothetical protein